MSASTQPSPQSDQSQPKPLSDADLEHFYARGHVVLHDCFPREAAEEAQAKAFRRLGYDPKDPSTWQKDRIHMPGTTKIDVKTFAPKAYWATCQLLGGEERMAPYGWSDAYIVNLREGADRPWDPPSAAAKGWHKDGDFFRHFLDSPEQGLLTIVLWTDVVERGGPTYIACDSVPVVARCLADHPEGLLPKEIPTRELINQCNDFAQMTGRAGDVVLLHPYMLHAVSQNLIGAIRIITNPPAHLKEPMNFNREDPAEFSPVERAVLRGLGVERYDFRPTGQRERVVPERVKRQQQMLEEEKARLGTAAV